MSHYNLGRKFIKAIQKQNLAKKHFGQNFLEDESVLDAIIQSIPTIERAVELVEIGAGLGDLTNKLLGLGNITTYEVDEELIPHLQERFKEALECGRLNLKRCDVLESWRGCSLRENPYFLIANLPYYIATLLVVKLIKDPLAKGCVVMMQKEVAQKFCAQCGESDFSALSVLAQSVGETRFLFDVLPTAFVPQPKVISSVFLLTKDAGGLDAQRLDALESLLKIAFSAPRKTLLNNLAKHYEKKKVLEALETLSLEIHKRPHEVDTTDYHRLLKLL